MKPVGLFIWLQETHLDVENKHLWDELVHSHTVNHIHNVTVVRTSPTQHCAASGFFSCDILTRWQWYRQSNWHLHASANLRFILSWYTTVYVSVDLGLNHSYSCLSVSFTRADNTQAMKTIKYREILWVYALTWSNAACQENQHNSLLLCVMLDFISLFTHKGWDEIWFVFVIFSTFDLIRNSKIRT